MRAFGCIAACLLAIVVGPEAARAAPRYTGDATACVEDGHPVRLTVSVFGVRSGDGLMTITVYGDNPDDFLAPGKKLGRVRVAARQGVTEACLAVPERTSYAITVYHDEDGDGDFNRNFFGYPLEGYGVSNDGATLLGIPSYESARFTAGPGENAVSVTLAY
ncbi:DUF2141 domain-containing protein [Roseospira marina]|uniref:DUF2141 domain-containing protein n=1 Tax=Roseospira marina TaxID=140057 RepID=UPI0014796226|nr:DUF2141 domain-containing protein [Roseospira marina]MBB4315850.1 uncharacterized protein (DUF2141 family) [Roseospira marina]MBB5089010.1 uncharacterized protein (DUF2141 family) [Roseospira marina]